MKPDMRKAFWVFLATTLAGLLIFAISVYQVLSLPRPQPPAPPGATMQITIPRGATAQDVADILDDAGLIKNPMLFRLYTVQRGAASPHPPRPLPGEGAHHPQGTGRHAGRAAWPTSWWPSPSPRARPSSRSPICWTPPASRARADFISAAVNANFVRGLELPGPSLEGYLYPDTYRFRPAQRRRRGGHLHGAPAQAGLRGAAGQYGAGLDKLKQPLGFEDRHVVTLASIVEKETGRADERPRIAQVLINRLTLPNFKPRILQTDPTIIYGCTVAPLALGKASPACQKFKNNNIQRIHLNDRENEYNTYTNEGLPPGPIANPGRGSLAAVMKPDGSPFLYLHRRRRRDVLLGHAGRARGQGVQVPARRPADAQVAIA